MRLKHIAKVDFRKSEATNFDTFRRARATKAVVASLGAGDLIMFINMSEDQLVFIHGFDTVSDGKQTLRVLSSRRLRISGGRWNPLRLANYAEEVGLQLDGLKRFEDYYKRLRS